MPDDRQAFCRPQSPGDHSPEIDHKRETFNSQRPSSRSKSLAESSLRQEAAFESIAREVRETVCEAPLIGSFCQ
jgi:hypothetical protein